MVALWRNISVLLLVLPYVVYTLNSRLQVAVFSYKNILKRSENAMNNRILVSMIFRTDGINLRTVSRYRKSPHRFYILRHRLAELEHKSEIIVHDINSFAVLRRDTYARTIEIELTWLSSDG